MMSVIKIFDSSPLSEFQTVVHAFVHQLASSRGLKAVGEPARGV